MDSEIPLAAVITRFMTEASDNDEAADYEARGRIYERLPLDWLAGAWVRAFRRWFSADAPADYRPVADLGAEFLLRGKEPPYAELQPELKRAREAAMNRTPYSANVMRCTALHYLTHGLPCSSDSTPLLS